MKVTRIRCLRREGIACLAKSADFPCITSRDLCCRVGNIRYAAFELSKGAARKKYILTESFNIDCLGTRDKLKRTSVVPGCRERENYLTERERFENDYPGTRESLREPL